MTLENVLSKVKGTNHAALYHQAFFIEKPYWICENKEEASSSLILDEQYDLKVQNKHFQSPLVSLTKTFKSETQSFDYEVRTKLHFRGITPGQVILIGHFILHKQNKQYNFFI